MKKLLCLLGLLCLAGAELRAQEVKRPQIKEGTYYGRTTKAGVTISIAYPKDWDGAPAADQIRLWWRNWAWNPKTDVPYTQATQQIDAALKAGTSPTVLLTRYKAALASEPWNPLKSYRWAYASWLASHKVADRQGVLALVAPAVSQFAETPFPASYHYARLGFLLNATQFPHPSLKRLGERLLARNPKDEAVLLPMIKVLSTTIRPQDDQQALRYLAYFRRKYPTDTRYTKQYADLKYYFFIRQFPRDQKKADVAIAALQQYQKVAPTPADKKWVAVMVRDIKEHMYDWNLYERKYWLKEQAKERQNN